MAAERKARRVQCRALSPLRDAVFRQRRAGLGVAHGRLRVRHEGTVVIGDDHRVSAENSIVGRALVFEPEEQALLAQQSNDEVEVALLILDAQASLRIDAAIGQIPAPGRCQPALAGVVGKHVLDDLDHALALEHIRIAAMAEERQPRLDHQPVAGQTAIAADDRRFGDVAMKRPQLAATRGGEQLEQHRLADQRLQLDVRVAGQRMDDDAKAGRRLACLRADAFVNLGALGEQRVGAERRVQNEQPLVLRRRAGKRR